MFLIFPLGHERMEARRWPVVTLAIVILCVLALVAQMLVSGSNERRFMALAAEADELLSDHPGLRAPESLVRLFGPMEAAKGDPKTEATSPTNGSEDVARLRLDAIATELAELEEKLPTYRFGVRKGSGALTYVTYAFLHGGILHLVFNLWFLWLAGSSLEDRWGRPVYAGFYLAAAVIGGISHRYFSAHSHAPLIGASGAVAGAMGAFLVIHGIAKIRFAYFFWFFSRPKAGTFEASAFLMLPLWLASELVSLVLPDDGTSHLAHVGGFAFGGLAALVLKHTGADRRLDSAIDTKTTRFQDARIEKAASLGFEKRYPEAFALLDEVERELPQGIDQKLEMLRLSHDAGDRDRERAAYAGLVGAYFAESMLEPALDLVREVRQRGLEDDLPRDARLAWADALARSGQTPFAESLYRPLAAGDDVLGLRAAVALGTLAAKAGRPDEARQIFLRAQASPHRTVDLSQRIEARLLALK